MQMQGSEGGYCLKKDILRTWLIYHFSAPSVVLMHYYIGMIISFINNIL